MKETLHKAQSLDNGLKESQTVNKFYVYALICPIDHEIKYIGATIEPEKRFKQHLKDSYNVRKKDWINSLSNLDKIPFMKILGIYETEYECAEVEQFYINKYRNKILNGVKKMPYRYSATEEANCITAHIPFDRNIYEQIKQKAKEMGLTVSAYIRLAVLDKMK